jgi:hypothetical protein
MKLFEKYTSLSFGEVRERSPLFFTKSGKNFDSGKTEI